MELGNVIQNLDKVNDVVKSANTDFCKLLYLMYCYEFMVNFSHQISQDLLRIQTKHRYTCQLIQNICQDEEGAACWACRPIKYVMIK